MTLPLLSDEPVPSEVPWTLDRAVAVFLNRWAFNWRGERRVIEHELRLLIAEAQSHADRTPIP